MKDIQNQNDKEEEKGECKSEEGVDQIEGSSSTILYQILGLPQKATQIEIKKAYRKLALLKHPDKNPDDKEAANNFAKLNKAYKILSDPAKRAKYD